MDDPAMGASIVVDLDPGTSDLELLAQAYDEVLRPSFSADELGSRDDFVAMVREGLLEASLLVDDTTVAAAGVDEPHGRGEVHLLAYLAARPGGRGKGSGGLLLEHLRRKWESSGAAAVLAEVHDPRIWPDGPDERPQARVDF